ncbi:MAG TPA: pyridoxal-phosphate dependent enzyme [Thermomicrobiales bacterium]
MSALPIDIEDVRAAQARLACVPEILRTPLVPSLALGERLGCRVWLKLENLQRIGSYKIRGAYNNIASLPPNKLQRGLIAASAGNHAQGIGFAAQKLGVARNTLIFVPRPTPATKLRNTRRWGVRVVRYGEDFSEANHVAHVKAEKWGRTFVEPFDDWQTIAGQGTVGLEILSDLPDVDVIVVPVGGGGLLSGIAVAVAACRPQTRVIGVEAEGAPCLLYSLQKGAPTELPFRPATVADGINVRCPGEKTFAAIRHFAERGIVEIVTVREKEIVQAIADLLIDAKTMAEGAGAVGIAALAAGKVPGLKPNTQVAVVVSGGNIDPELTWRIMYERTVAHMLVIRVSIPDRPGELMRLLEPIAAANVNIIDVDVNRHDARPNLGQRVVELCLAVTDEQQARQLFARLRERNYLVQRSRWENA